jgi:tetratricopeptide (TPR) repeat protein
VSLRALLFSICLATSTLAPVVAFAQSTGDEESQLLVEEGKRALAKKDYKHAGAVLDKALAVAPRRLDIYILRATIFGIQKQHDQAVALLDRAHKLAPDNVRVNTALGIALIDAKKPTEGVPLLEKIVAIDKSRYDAQVALGNYYATQGQWKEAANALSAYFSSRPSALAREDALHRYDQANALLRSGNAKSALDIYKSLLKSNPQSERARLGVAWATAASSCKRAMPVFEGLADLEAKYAEVALVRGRCALMLGKLDDALARAERYRKSAPNAIEGWVLLGDVRGAQNNWKEAEAAYLHVVEKDPDATSALKLARAERMLQKFGAAAERLRAAGPPKNYEDDWTLEYGETLYALKQDDVLREQLTPFVKTHEGHAQGEFLLGAALALGGDHANAVSHLVIANKAGEPRAAKLLVDSLNTLAAEDVKKKDLPGARQSLEQAMNAGGSPLTTRNYGAVLIAQNELDKALALLKNADQNDADAQFLLARAYHASKKYDDARPAYARAVKLYGKDPRGDTALRDAAYAELADGRGEEAVDLMDQAISGSSGAQRKSLEATRLAIARAAATDAMRASRFSVAVKLLRGVEKTADGEALTELRCDLALAATGATQRDLALDLLRGLERAKAKCPFVSPVDDIGLPILIAWNEDASPSRAKKALDRLEQMRRKATGVAEPLLRQAASDIALRAAAQAYASGNNKAAASFLATAKTYNRSSPEVAHNVAVLDIATGNVDAAISTLVGLVGDVPEARINLGIAYEKKGEPTKALAQWKAALAAGARHAQLKDWVDSKERLWGSP